jgi:hypothetical protein
MEKKVDTLQSKFNNVMRDSVPKSIFKKDGILENTNFPSADRIPNEKLREAYSRLFISHKELINEKESLLKTLREETIENEEQRNYIEILKQTLESTLMRNGLYTYVQNQKY